MRTLLVTCLLASSMAWAQQGSSTSPATQSTAPAAQTAQTPPADAPVEPNPLTAQNRHMYAVISDVVLRSAEKMPEEHYAFKPAETVRTFGQLVGHLADAQTMMCAAARAEKPASPPQAEKTKTTKADLIAALKEAMAYCKQAYVGVDDMNTGRERVRFMGSQTPRLGVLTTNLVHTMEHYGNMVTYMRMKDVVPPTSEPGFMDRAKKTKS